MDCSSDIVRLTYEQLKEMAERNNPEEVAGGLHVFACIYHYQRYSNVFFRNSDVKLSSSKLTCHQLLLQDC